MNESNETLQADQIEMAENEAESVSALIENPQPNEKLKAAMYGYNSRFKDQKND